MQTNESNSLDPQPRFKRAGKPRGLPLPAVLGGALLLALVGIAALAFLFYRTRSDVARLENERHRLETEQTQAALNQQAAEAKAKLAQARTHQEDALLTIRNTTNSLGRLLSGIRQLHADAEALKTSETGRRVAQHPNLVGQARRFYDTDLAQLPPEDEIVIRLEAMRRHEQQLLEATGTTFEPPADMTTSTQEARAWADQQLEQLARQQRILSGLVSESKIKLAPTALTAETPTLEQATRKLADAEALALQQMLVATNQYVSNEGAKRVTEAEAEKVRTRIAMEVEKRDREIADLKAELERKRALHDAEIEVTNTKTKISIAQTEDEVRRLKLQRKSEDPAVMAKLRSFTTPGHWQPRGKTVKAQPLSFSQIQGTGALNDGMEGLQKLVDIVFTRDDGERPRIKAGNTSRSWKKTPAEIDHMAEIQGLLIELGPILVEQGKLSQ